MDDFQSFTGRGIAGHGRRASESLIGNERLLAETARPDGDELARARELGSHEAKTVVWFADEATACSALPPSPTRSRPRRRPRVEQPCGTRR